MPNTQKNPNGSDALLRKKSNGNMKTRMLTGRQLDDQITHLWMKRLITKAVRDKSLEDLRNSREQLKEAQEYANHVIAVARHESKRPQ